MKHVFSSWCMLVCLFGLTQSSRILIVSPTVSRSHYVMFGVLSRALAARGHNVTTITTFPGEAASLENLTEISVKSVRSVFLNDLPMEQFGGSPLEFHQVTPMLLEYVDNTAKVFNFTAVQMLITSESDQFDLVITESFIDDVFLAFAHKFNAPVITMGSCNMYSWTADRFGVPTDPAYIPGFHSGYSRHMGFTQRVRNALLDVAERLFYHFYLEPRASQVVWKYFGEGYPPVRGLMSNISMYFINTPASLYGPRPYPPQVVDISGIHLQPATPLPQELDQWMNDSVHGVIYFSFGSMLRGATLPNDKFKSCCECWTLKQGTLVQAAVEAYAAVYIFSCVAPLLLAYSSIDKPGPDHTLQELSLIFATMLFLLAGLLLMKAMCLLVGAINRRATLVLAAIVLSVIQLVLNISFCVYLCMYYAWFVGLLSMITSPVTVYCLLVLYSYYSQLKTGVTYVSTSVRDPYTRNESPVTVLAACRLPSPRQGTTLPSVTTIRTGSSTNREYLLHPQATGDQPHT